MSLMFIIILIILLIIVSLVIFHYRKNLMIILPYKDNRPIITGGSENNDSIFNLLTFDQFQEISVIANMGIIFLNVIKYVREKKKIDQFLKDITQLNDKQLSLIYNSFNNSPIIKDSVTINMNLFFNKYMDCNKEILCIGNEFYFNIFKNMSVYFIPMLIIEQNIDKDIKIYNDLIREKVNNCNGEFFPAKQEELNKYKIKINKNYDLISYTYIPHPYDLLSKGPTISNIYLDISIKYIHECLLHLNKNGDFIFILKQCYNNDFINKYINYLTSMFKDVKYEAIEEGIFMIFLGFKGIDKNSKYPKTIYGKVEKPFFGLPPVDNIPVDLDLDISPVNSLMRSYFNDYYNGFVKFYYSTQFEDKEELKTKLIYERLNKIRALYEENNMKFDDYFTASITNYNKIVYQEFISMNATVFSSLISYNKKYKIGDKLKVGNGDGYDEFKKYGNMIFANRDAYSVAMENNKVEYKLIKHISEDFTRGVANYLLQHFKIDLRRINNAFVKLWEIYITYPVITENINAFHMCEAPGQWIKTTEYFINKKTNYEYNWLANSLNPTHPENIKKFGENIIDDTYGLLEKYKDKWLFSIDNTGDITVPANIRWYRENVKNINLVTGDAGIPTELPLVYMQKLDYSQYLITAAVASKGANCVIKCFTQYVPKHKISLESSGFFVNLLYLYYLSFETVYLYKPYASGSISGEFYIIGLGFLGVSDDELEKLLDVQANFEENMTFFPRADIPDEFVAQVEKFTADMTYHKTHALNRLQFLVNVLNDSEDKYKFKELLANIDNIHEARFKEWVKLFRFL